MLLISLHFIGVGALSDGEQVAFLGTDRAVHVVDVYGLERWTSTAAAMPIEFGDGTLLAIGDKTADGFPVVVLDGSTGALVGDCGVIPNPAEFGVGLVDSLETRIRFGGRWHEDAYWITWSASRNLISGMKPHPDQVAAYRRVESGALRCEEVDGAWVVEPIKERQLPDAGVISTPTMLRAGNGVVLKLREDGTVLWELEMLETGYRGPRPP